MKTPREALLKILVIATLLATHYWSANKHELEEPSFHAGDELSPPLETLHVKHVDWSADGEELLSFSRGEPDCLGNLALHALAFETTDRITIDSLEGIANVAFAPDAQHILVGTYSAELLWIALESSETTRLVNLQQSRTVFTSSAIAKQGGLVAAGTSHGSIYVCDPEDPCPYILTADRESSIGELQFSSDGKQLLSAQNDGRVGLWELADRKLLQEFTGHGGVATAAVLLPDDQRILTAGLDDTIRLWDIATAQELWRGEVGFGSVSTAAISADGTTAAFGGYSRKIVVWDLEHGKMKSEIDTTASAVFHLKFSPDGMLLAAACSDRNIRLYDMRTGTEKKGFQAVKRRSHAARAPEKRL